MANHKSSLKRIRQEEKRRLHNRYYAAAIEMYPSVQKALDKLAKINVIHANKAANLKSKLAKYIQKLG